MGKMDFPSIATQFSKVKQYTDTHCGEDWLTIRQVAPLFNLDSRVMLCSPPSYGWNTVMSLCSINAEWARAQGPGLPMLSELYHTPFLYPGICQSDAKYYEALPGPRG